MITRSDLKVIESESYYDGHTRDVVEFDGKHFIAGSVTCPVNPEDENAFFKWLEGMGPDGIPILLGLVPLNETYVMEAKWDEEELAWRPKNECGIQCETGVCNKRLATNTQVGDHDLAYNMLVNHLNA